MFKNTKGQEKGITLIALVITIIVLLILAGISISMLSGDNSILRRATDARDKTEYAKAQEEFSLSYLEAVGDKYLDNNSGILTKVVVSMNAKGYPTQQGSANGGETDKVTAITLKDVEGNEICLGTNKTKEIELEFTESTETPREAPYYVLADGKYYEILKNSSGDYELATTETPASIVTGETPKAYSVKVSSSNSDALGVSYDSSSKKINLTSGTTTTESPITITISYEDEDGNAKFTPISFATSVSNAITVADIVNQTFETTATKTEFYQGFYGAVVTNYRKTIDTSLNDQWKIFYAGTMGDETEAHIYLIADSYVNYTSLPTKTISGTTYSFKKSTDWRGFFSISQWNPANINDGILPAYSTGTMIGSSYATIANMQNLNYSYYHQNYAGTAQPNMRAVAIMLDTNIWSSFMDSNGKAKYAIGGPTVEMLMKSYNDSHGTDYGAKASSETGYQITQTATRNNGWANNISSMVSTSDTNKLYVSESAKTNASGYWLTSPSADHTNCIMYTNFEGTVNSNGYGSDIFGFRPLVCLNSNVKLERQENGTYIIK